MNKLTLLTIYILLELLIGALFLDVWGAEKHSLKLYVSICMDNYFFNCTFFYR